MVRKTSRMVEDLYFSKDELVFGVLSKYLSQRDASFLKRNMSGLFKGDKVVIGEYIIGNIAHKYAEDNYSPQVANLVGSSGSYFSPMHPLTIDLKTGRVILPQFVLLARNIERELKYQYTRLTRELDELCRDIAEEILVVLDEDPIDRGEEIQYDYESMKRNRHRCLDTIDESLSMNERHEFRHNLSNNPTDYERYVNYAETLVLVCEHLTEAAEGCLRRVEDNEEFYTDPKNERWYGFDEKMEQIAKAMRQIESLINKIDTKM